MKAFRPVKALPPRAADVVRRVRSSFSLWRFWATCGAVLAVITGPVIAQSAPQHSSESATSIDTLVALQQVDQRVADISWRILTRSLDLCPIHRVALGITLHDIRQYKPELRSDARAAFRFVRTYPSVLTVASGSPAQMAGILPNDVLKAVNGFSLASEGMGNTPLESSASYEAVERAMRILEALPAHKIALELERDGKPVVVSVEPRAACPSRVELVPSNELNGSANGEVAQVNGALVNWVRNDDELALVIAHEVAHNVLRHDSQIASEKIDTGLFGGLGKSGRKLRDMERAADRLGTWMAARGGYEYRLAPDFWRRLTRRSGIGAVWATTHPTAESRADALVPVVREIDAAMANHWQPATSPIILPAAPTARAGSLSGNAVRP